MNEPSPNEHDDDDETAQLLLVEPVPVSHNSVPPHILRTLHDEPRMYYQQTRRRIYWITGILLLILVLTSLIYNDFKHVTRGLMFSIKNFEINELTNPGILFGISGVMSFQYLGMFEWVCKLNESEILIFENLKFFANDTLFAELETKGTIIDFTIEENQWSFQLNNSNLCILDGEQLAYSLQRKENINLRTRLGVNGYPISVNKNLRLGGNFDDIETQIVSRIIDGLSINQIERIQYDPNKGFIGAGELSMGKIHGLPSLNTTLNVNVNDTLYPFLTVELQKSKSIHPFKFLFFNIPMEVSNYGILDEIIDCLLNKESFDFVVNGNDDEKNIGVPWLHEFWNNFQVNIPLNLSELVAKVNTSMEIDPVFGDTYVEDFEIGIKDGRVWISSIFETILKPYFQSFFINISGDIIMEGYDIAINCSVSKNSGTNEAFSKFTLQDLLIDVNDVDEGVRFLQNILDRNEVYSNFELGLSILLTTPYYTGNLNLDQSIFVDLTSFTSIFDNFKILEKGMELIDMKLIEGDEEHMQFDTQTNMRLPTFIENITNAIDFVNLVLNHRGIQLIELTILDTESSNKDLPMEFKIDIKTRGNQRASKFEEFVGQFISGNTMNATINGLSTDDLPSISGANVGICKVFEKIRIPINITSSDIEGNSDGKGFFIRDTIMHLFTKEVEMTLFNPISNSNIILEIDEAEAISDGYRIGYLKDEIVWIVKPGIWESPRAKVEYANVGSAGWKILENAIRGDGYLNNMTVRAVLRVKLMEVPQWSGMNIMYSGKGKGGKVRW